MKNANIPRIVVPPFRTTIAPENESTPEIENILLSLLHNIRRKLTPDQQSYVLSKVAEEPTALYMRLALREVSRWSSCMSRGELNLSEGVRDLLHQIFETIERDYGRKLTRIAFGFITYSVEGITDNEMCDLLTLHDDVLHEVNQYNDSKRVPTHVWLRLRGEIDGLIIEQSGGCLTWYHRQLKEAAELRYEEEKQLEIRIYFCQLAQINP